MMRLALSDDLLLRCVCMYVCKNGHVNIYIYMYICMYIYVCIYIYIYIYIYEDAEEG